MSTLLSVALAVAIATAVAAVADNVRAHRQLAKLRKLESIRDVLHLQPRQGDLIVVYVPESMPNESVVEVAESLNEILPDGVKCAVLDESQRVQHLTDHDLYLMGYERRKEDRIDSGYRAN